MSVLRIAVTAFFAAWPALAAAQEDCEAKSRILTEAIVKKDVRAVENALQAVLNSNCPGHRIPFERGRAATALVEEVNRRLIAGQTGNQVEALLVRAHEMNGIWQATELLGRLRMQQRRYRDAARLFDEALTLIDNEAATPEPPGLEIISLIFKRAMDARMLSPSYVRSVSRCRGSFVFDALRIHGFRPTAVAIPITFRSGAATMTDDDRKFAEDLAKILSEQGVERVTLIGHTDDVGEPDSNMRLSLARANAVKDFLLQNGVKAVIDVEGRGESLPYEIENRHGLPIELRRRLDRRVEYVRDGSRSWRAGCS